MDFYFVVGFHRLCYLLRSSQVQIEVCSWRHDLYNIFETDSWYQHQAKKMNNNPNPTEQQFRKVLSQVNTKTFIGFCIAGALETGKPSFETLVKELKDQLRDAPDSLKNVISDKGIELLKSFL